MDKTEAKVILDEILSQGAEKSALFSVRQELTELNVEKDSVNFFRTTQNEITNIEAYSQNKKAEITVNDSGKEGIKKAAKFLKDTLNSSLPDEAYEISPSDFEKTFLGNSKEPEKEKMIDAFSIFLSDAKRKYPEIIFSDTTFSHKKSKIIYANTRGCYLAEDKSYYSLSLFFTAKKGDEISSFNYLYLDKPEISENLISTGVIDETLQKSAEQIKSKTMGFKFKGDLVLTPKASLAFMDDFLSPLHEDRLISGTSIYKDKLEEKIASDILNVKFSPLSDLSVSKDNFTFDGFLTKDMGVIENGFLKNFIVSYYGSRKTGLPRSLNMNDNYMEILQGETDLDLIISGVNKGILMDRFSGGTPSVNGQLSGVCKNSYYIEGGKIKYPVKEVMMTGNTAQMLLDVKAVSKQTVDFGKSRAPYILIKNVLFS
ncbi:TldD/PmbA family protein [candidate division WOR-3 bacterium]|nr:TldD/PmbA family protein [candidate division WOR-3 bacterium]